MQYNLTEKLKWNDDPVLIIRDTELTINSDAETVLQLMDIMANRGEMQGAMEALNLLLGSEVLKTIVAPGWTDIGMTCAIILMRAGVTVLLKWENKTD